MRVERLVLGDLGTNCWLASDDAGGPLVVIDPADEPDEVLAAVAGRDVASVILTHGHFDHLGAADALRDATGAPLAVHREDGPFLSDPATTGGLLFGYRHSTRAADRLLVDGDTVQAGELAMRVLHTPGHTPGGICLYADEEGQLFSGDTLFASSVGRTDFPGGDSRALHRSIVERLASLPDDTLVHPGHGPDTTIGRERRVNPFFPTA